MAVGLWRGDGAGGVGRLIVLLNVTGQITDEDTCWFDNLGVYRLTQPTTGANTP